MAAVLSDSQFSKCSAPESAFEHVHVPSAWRGIFATVLGAGSLLGGADPAEVFASESRHQGHPSASIESATFEQTELKNGEQAALFLNSGDAVYQINCSAFSVIPKRPLSRQLAKAYAERATTAFSRLPVDTAGSSTEPRALLSSDGYRFEMVAGDRTFLLTEQRAFEIITSPGYDREQFKSSRTTCSELRRKLQNMLYEGLSEIEQEEIAVRIERYCLLQDLSFLRSAIDEESKIIAGHRELESLFAEQRELTEQTLQDIEWNVSQDFALLDPNYSEDMVDRNWQSLSRVARDWHIELPDQTENTLTFLTEAVSRKMLLRALNQRANRIEDLLQQRLDSKNSSPQTQQAKELLAESYAVWKTALTALQDNSGYPAYDSKHVGTEDFVEAEKLLDSTSSSQEAILGLESDYCEITERSNVLRSETENSLQQLTAAAENTLRWGIRDCASGARGYLQENPHDFNRYIISLNQGRHIEEYDNGKILQRSVTKKDGSQRDILYSNGSKRLMRVYDPDGRLLRQVGYRAGDNWREYVSDRRRHCYTHYDRNDQRLWRVRFPCDAPEMIGRIFFPEKGKPIGNYAYEKQKAGGTLSVEDYLRLLADRLDSPEQLEIFLDSFFQYTSDYDGEFFQTFRATVEKDTSPFAGGKRLRGDCDDYAFFARDILRAQGKNAHVVGVPKHATCIWLEQDSSNRYHAYSIGTFGLDKNGQTSDAPPPAMPHAGFETPAEAINSLATKYRSPGVGLAQGQVFRFIPDSICILEVDEELQEDGTYHSWRNEEYKDISIFLDAKQQKESTRTWL